MAAAACSCSPTPTKLDLVIDKRAAKAVGISVPPAVLFAADEVSE